MLDRKIELTIEGFKFRMSEDTALKIRDQIVCALNEKSFIDQFNDEAKKAMEKVKEIGCRQVI